ncbi:MAG: Small acid-soluble spore protein, alpha/beta type [Firmicutes bacterium]|nr:Small acid-soluble spore protein, alpha/beta type [Bacillota bacterium]MDI6706508.1 alpha/beta-type small acid-soluble spore protein [Bacillota bacterium]
MAAGQQTPGKKLVQKAHPALDDMKYEIASEFNLPVYQGSEDYWGNLSSRDCGRVGGEMVKRMIAIAERQISGQ